MATSAATAVGDRKSPQRLLDTEARPVKCWILGAYLERASVSSAPEDISERLAIMVDAHAQQC